MKTLLPFLAVCALAFTGCTTTRQEVRVLPDGSTTNVTVKVPDVATTAKVKSAADGLFSMGIRRSLARFPKEADTIAFYATAVGGVFCDMQARKQFDPSTLEAGIAALVLPHVEDPELKLWIADARDALRATYGILWADRFSAELPPDEWPAVVADIFCDSIDRGLKDSGRPGVKTIAKLPPAE
jgi:hypothetical protein